MVNVKVVREFRDRTADMKLRKQDEKLTVSEERAEKLVGLGLVTVVEGGEENAAEQPTETPEAPQEAAPEAPKKRAKQK